VKQALHIFRKDVRRLWPLIAVVLALFAFDYAQISGLTAPLPHGVPLGFYEILLLTVLACWFLGARVVQEEALPGERQFWLTRPYDRSGLLLAKLLLVSTFEFIPLVVAGCASEVHYGVPILPNMGGLLLWGIVASAWLILPGIAIASVTTNLRWFVGALFAVSVAVGVYAFYGALTPHWFSPAVAAPGITNLAGYLPLILLTIGGTVFQYSRRRTNWSRAILAAGLLAPAVTLPADGLVSLSTRWQNPGFDSAVVHIAFDESAPPRFDGTQFGDRTCESLRLNVYGLPNGASLESFGDSALEIQPWSVGGKIEIASDQSAVEQFGDGFREVLCLDSTTFEAARNQSLTLRLSINATVRSTVDEIRVPLIRGWVGSAGYCGLGWNVGMIDCQLAMPAFNSLNVGYELSGDKVYSTTFTSNEYSFPLSASAPVRDVGFTFAPQGMIPVTQQPDIWEQGATLILRTQRAIGYIERDLVYHGLRLADKAAPQ
jgi:hypothetical protein